MEIFSAAFFSAENAELLTTAGSRTEYGGMKKFALSLCAAAAVCCASADEVFSPAPEDVKILGTEGDLAKVLKRDIGFGEGALYRPSTGEVFFSDQPKNMIYRWTEKDGFSVFMRPAGYTGAKGQVDRLRPQRHRSRRKRKPRILPAGASAYSADRRKEVRG